MEVGCSAIGKKKCTDYLKIRILFAVEVTASKEASQCNFHGINLGILCNIKIIVI
jgi:hypothetical protein